MRNDESKLALTSSHASALPPLPAKQAEIAELYKLEKQLRESPTLTELEICQLCLQEASARLDKLKKHLLKQYEKRIRTHMFAGSHPATQNAAMLYLFLDLRSNLI